MDDIWFPIAIMAVGVAVISIGAISGNFVLLIMGATLFGFGTGYATRLTEREDRADG
jgi:hypothetical protein